MRMNEKRRDACVSLLCGGVGGKGARSMGKARQCPPCTHALSPSGKM